jgi:hypothetical protein
VGRGHNSKACRVVSLGLFVDLTTRGERAFREWRDGDRICAQKAVTFDDDDSRDIPKCAEVCQAQLNLDCLLIPKEARSRDAHGSR